MSDTGSSSSAGMGAMSLASGFMQSRAAKDQGNWAQQQSETNARLAEMQSADAVKRGAREVEQIRKQGSKIAGAQKASLAAQGIDINVGSASDVQSETEAEITRDILTAKNNAFREAWGYKVQAKDIRAQGKFQAIAGRTQSAASLISGGMQAVEYGAKAYEQSKKG